MSPYGGGSPGYVGGPPGGPGTPIMPSPGPGPGPDSDPLYMMKNVPNSLPGGVSTEYNEYTEYSEYRTDFTDSDCARRVPGWWGTTRHQGEQQETMELMVIRWTT